MTVTDKPRLLITRKVFPEVLGLLEPHFRVRANEDDEEWSQQHLRDLALQADALFVTASDRIDEPVLRDAASVKIISTGSVGFNQIDVALCRSRGILLTNTPDVLTETTADMAWALLMAAARRVCESERWLRQGLWKRWAFDQFLGADIHGATLGIVGMGRIGSAVARRARGFSMNVLYHNRSRAQNESEIGATWVDKDELLSRADHIVLVLPYSAQNHHLIGERELRLMKPTAVLVNIARGGIVDDRALALALREGRLGAAGLDVYENEPALAPELLDLPNVALTPHIGSASRATRVGMAMLAARNLVAWSRGEPLLTPV